MTPHIVVARGAEDAGEQVADVVEDALEAARHEARDPVLGLATGSTPIFAYRALERRRLELSRAWAFALDEYVGLEEHHPESYSQVLRREAIEPLGLDPARVSVPGRASRSTAGRDEVTLDAACAAFEAAIQAVGGVDVQLLGIGSNGHIAFNEPGSRFDSSTRVTELSEQTRRDNSRFFASLDEVPTHAVTQGLGTVFRARRIVLMAFGEHKARAVAAALGGPPTEDVPASIIQLHPDTVVLLDEAAASLLDSDNLPIAEHGGAAVGGR